MNGEASARGGRQEADAVYVVGTAAEQAQLQQRLQKAGTATVGVFVIERTLEGDLLFNTLPGEQMESGNFQVNTCASDPMGRDSPGSSA